MLAPARSPVNLIPPSDLFVRSEWLLRFGLLQLADLLRRRGRVVHRVAVRLEFFFVFFVGLLVCHPPSMPMAPSKGVPKRQCRTAEAKGHVGAEPESALFAVDRSPAPDADVVLLMETNDLLDSAVKFR